MIIVLVESYLRRCIKPLEALLTSHKRLVVKDSAVSISILSKLFSAVSEVFKSVGNCFFSLKDVISSPKSSISNILHATLATIASCLQLDLLQENKLVSGGFRNKSVL